MTHLIPAPHADTLPSSDADRSLFYNYLSANWNPTTFGVLGPLAATLVSLAATYETALANSSAPASRTTASIALKDAANAQAASFFRDAIRSAQAAFLGGSASAAQLLAIGVRPNDLVRSPINAPVFAPMLAATGSAPGVARFRVTQVDQNTGAGVTTRAFAYGIVGIELQRRVGTGEYLLRQTVKRVLFEDSTADLAVGTVAAYRSRYITSRGLTSPWSSVVNAVAF